MFFPTLFSLSCLQPARQEEEEEVVMCGGGAVGRGVRTDEVSMATPHWHAPDWTVRWLIIQRICLKKTIK